MLDKFLEEIEELKQYKRKYECAMMASQDMSDLLFELMTEKYQSTSVEDRIKYHKETMCRSCRYCLDCEKDLPENIGEPCKSDKAWIPSTVACCEFEWS